MSTLTTHDRAWIGKMATTSPASRETLTKALATAADTTGWETSEIRRWVDASELPFTYALYLLIHQVAARITKEIKCQIYPETIKRCGLLTGAIQ